VSGIQCLVWMVLVCPILYSDFVYCLDNHSFTFYFLCVSHVIYTVLEEVYYTVLEEVSVRLVLKLVCFMKKKGR
jgi:hypothetical protein